jgi:hypothetical protein
MCYHHLRTVIFPRVTPPFDRERERRGRIESSMLSLLHYFEYELTTKQLRKLHYNGHNDEWIQKEFDEIKSTIIAEKLIAAPGWLPMFTVPQWRTRLFQATLVQVFTQFSGYV